MNHQIRNSSFSDDLVTANHFILTPNTILATLNFQKLIFVADAVTFYGRLAGIRKDQPQILVLD